VTNDLKLTKPTALAAQRIGTLPEKELRSAFAEWKERGELLQPVLKRIRCRPRRYAAHLFGRALRPRGANSRRRFGGREGVRRKIEEVRFWWALPNWQLKLHTPAHRPRWWTRLLPLWEGR
jgi:hypothetical protein